MNESKWNFVSLQEISWNPSGESTVRRFSPATMSKNQQEQSEDPDPSEYLFVSLEQKRKDQTKPFDGKKMVWVPDEKEGFVLGNIVSTKGDMCTVDVKGDEVWGVAQAFNLAANLPFFSIQIKPKILLYQKVNKEPHTDKNIFFFGLS